MKRIILFYILLILAGCSKQQQEEKHYMGALEDDPVKVARLTVYTSSIKYRKYPQHKGDTSSVPVDTVYIAPPPTIPGATVEIKMPPVANQGSEGSCVAFAVGYYQESVEYKNILSPEYLFDLTKSDPNTCSGSSVYNTYVFLQSYGTCTWQSLPYTAGGCSITPTDQQIAEAANYRISSYGVVPTTDTTAIKSLINANHPLVISFMVDSYFYNANSTFIWESYSSIIYGRHAVAICGYNDSKHAFKIINSWGTGWGDAGYTWIDYDFLKTVSPNAYIMTL